MFYLPCSPCEIALFKYFHFATDASADAKPGENPLEGVPPPQKKLGFFGKLAATITGTPPSAKRRLSEDNTNKPSRHSIAQKNRGIGPGASAAEATASPTSSAVSTSATSSPSFKSRSLRVPAGGSGTIDTANGENSSSRASSPTPSPRSKSPLPFSNVAEDRDLLDLTHSEQEFLLRDLVHEYADIYFENPRAFAPFYKGHKEVMTRTEQARMVYHHMKGETKDETLKKLFHNLKPKIMAHIEFILEEKALKVARVLPKMINAGANDANGGIVPAAMGVDSQNANPPSTNAGSGSTLPPTEKCLTVIGMMQTNKEEYLGAVNHVVGELRTRCIDIMERVNERIATEIIPNYDKIKDCEAVNDRVLNILFESDLRVKIQEYHAAYRKAASSFPGRILLSDLFRNRIESRSTHDKITLNDLIVAVEECTGHLRHTIHGFMHAHPELLTELFNLDPDSCGVITHGNGGDTPREGEACEDLPHQFRRLAPFVSHLHKALYLLARTTL